MSVYGDPSPLPAEWEIVTHCRELREVHPGHDGVWRPCRQRPLQSRTALCPRPAQSGSCSAAAPAPLPVLPTRSNTPPRSRAGAGRATGHWSGGLPTPIAAISLLFYTFGCEQVMLMPVLSLVSADGSCCSRALLTATGEKKTRRNVMTLNDGHDVRKKPDGQS